MEDGGKFGGGQLRRAGGVAREGSPCQRTKQSCQQGLFLYNLEFSLFSFHDVKKKRFWFVVDATC